MLAFTSCRRFLAVLVVALLGSVVVRADDQSITWVIPTTPYESLTVSVGDVLTFTWPTGGTHDVHKQASDECPTTSSRRRFLAEGDDHGDDHGDHEHPEDAIMLGDTSPVSYTITADDAGKTLYFVCLVGQHCAAGMKMAVTVEQDATSPTTAGATAWTTAVPFLLLASAALWI